VDFPYDDFRRGLLGAGCSESAVDAFTAFVEAANAGRFEEGLRRDAASTTPTTLEAFAREVFAPAYRRAEAGGA
jgi:hypothetical protein